MKRDMPSYLWNFWNSTMEKLDANEDPYEPIPEVLEDLCRFFSFGFTFVYEADHAGAFTLQHFFSVYDSARRMNSFSINSALGEVSVRQLAMRKAVIFDSDTDKDRLEQQLCGFFGANTLILIPLLDNGGNIKVLVGAGDRRGRTRQKAVDIAYSYSILRVIANYIKLHLYQIRIESADKALRSIIDNMGLDVFVNDFYTHEILYINRTMATNCGNGESMLGKKCWQVINGQDTPCAYCPQKNLVDEKGEPTGVYQWDYQRESDGVWLRMYSSAFPWVDGRMAQVVSSADITEYKRNEELIRRMALYDALTGLPNRRKLILDCEAFMRGGDDEQGYVLFMDLDGFKTVNDTLGHAAGDELLCSIAAFLEEDPLTAGRSYRHAGDEFVILCPKKPQGHLRSVIARLTHRFSRSWDLKGSRALCGASIGIAESPDDAATPDELLQCADRAMYEAKKGNDAVRFFHRGRYLTPEEYYKQNPVHI